MSVSEILVIDAASDAPVRLAGPESLVASSGGHGWEGVALEHQLLPGAELPLGYMRGHLFSVQLAPPRALHEWSGGRSRRIAVDPLDVVYRPAGEPVKVAWTGSSEMLNIALEPAFVPCGARIELASRVGPDPVVVHLSHALRAALMTPCPSQRLCADGIRTALVGHMLATYAHRRAAEREPRALSRAELLRIDELIDRDLAADLRVADLAATVFLSPFHFSRAFKLTTGFTPHRYVMHRRLDAARRLLERRVPDLDSIARQTGFCDSGHLARNIRRRFGRNPADFRAGR